MLAFFKSLDASGRSAALKRKAEAEGGGEGKVERRAKALMEEDWHDLSKPEQQLWANLASAGAVDGAHASKKKPLPDSCNSLSALWRAERPSASHASAASTLTQADSQDVNNVNGSSVFDTVGGLQGAHASVDVASGMPKDGYIELGIDDRKGWPSFDSALAADAARSASDDPFGIFDEPEKEERQVKKKRASRWDEVPDVSPDDLAMQKVIVVDAGTLGPGPRLFGLPLLWHHSPPPLPFHLPHARAADPSRASLPCLCLTCAQVHGLCSHLSLGILKCWGCVGGLWWFVGGDCCQIKSSTSSADICTWPACSWMYAWNMLRSS